MSRNLSSERAAAQKFAELQSDLFSTFGQATPSAPVLRCRNVTQTSVVLEWDPVSLATAELRTLSLYRNGSKAGNIPRDKLSTKISGLQVDHEYTFHLVLRTSAGTYSSERLTIMTQKLTDLTGITITPGVMAQPLRDSLEETVKQVGAKLIDTVRIDTTHFVCTEGRGQAWEKALEMNIPVVVPDWIKGCQREGRIVGVRGYYLNADPKLRQVGTMSINTAQSPASPMFSAVDNTQRRPSQQAPTIEHTPPTPEQNRTRKTSQTNGDDGNASEPPTPPPKIEPFPEAPTEMPEEAVEAHETPGTHSLPIRIDEQRDEDAESIASEATEKAPISAPLDSAQAEKEARPEEEEPQVSQETETEGDGTFDEVSL